MSHVSEGCTSKGKLNNMYRNFIKDLNLLFEGH